VNISHGQGCHGLVQGASITSAAGAHVERINRCRSDAIRSAQVRKASIEIAEKRSESLARRVGGAGSAVAAASNSLIKRSEVFLQHQQVTLSHYEQMPLAFALCCGKNGLHGA
jgi:hypothetical protein